MPIINTTLTLKDLPPPPPGKSGWPWTEQVEPLLERRSDDSEWPRISIVTPSYNQGQFIEETIRSILLQGYPNLEYIIIDGGSTDNSIEIIKKYESYLAYWVSEPDNGQSHALNKGFCKATGELIGWQNSDDYYHPEAFINAAQASFLFRDYEILYGSTNYVDKDSGFIKPYPVSSFDIHELIPYINMCNQAMFFRSSIFKAGDFIDETFRHAMDQEFFLRLALKGYKFYLIPEMIGYFRLHENSKGAIQRDSICVEECLKIYKSIYQNASSAPSLREKALLSIRDMGLASFGQSRPQLFRKIVQELASLAGLKVINFPLVIRYLLSLLGANNLEKLNQFKQTFGLLVKEHLP